MAGVLAWAGLSCPPTSSVALTPPTRPTASWLHHALLTLRHGFLPMLGLCSHISPSPGTSPPPLIHDLHQLQTHFHCEAFHSSFLLEITSMLYSLGCSRLCSLQSEHLCIYLLSRCFCIHLHLFATCVCVCAQACVNARMHILCSRLDCKPFRSASQSIPNHFPLTWVIIVAS